MTTPVLKLGVRVPRADAYALNQSALAPMIPMSPPVSEQEATAHWLFGSDFDIGSPATFPDLVSGQLLTKTGSVTVNSNNISLGVGANFLISPIADAAEQTVCCVVQQPSFSSLTPGAGSMVVGADNPTTQGSSLWIIGGASGPQNGFYAVTRPATVLLLATPGATGNFIFLGMSHAPQIGPIPPTRTVLTSSAPIVTTTALTKTAYSGHNVQIGATQISALGALVACELIIFNKHLTASQLAAVYVRSQARLSMRGITLV